MVKGVKARKKGRRNWPKIIGVLLFVTVMGTLIVNSALRQRAPQPLPPTPKPSANEYFIFSKGLAVGSGTENITILANQVGFHITPVGGNATNVYIYPLEGDVDREECPHFDEMINGTSVSVGPIEYPYAVLSEKEEEGWPFHFQITCNECNETEGEVTIYTTYTKIGA